MNFTEHRYESHDGLSLYYREYGAGDDVVLCLHGLTRNSKDFHELASRLASRHRVLCLDIRGRGQSDHDPKPGNYLPPVYARDVWTLMDGLRIRRFALVGTSLGGLIGFILAWQQADRLRGVVLNDIGPEIDPAVVKRLLQYAGRTPPMADWLTAANATKTAYELAFPGVPEEFWDAHVRLNWVERNDGMVAPDMDNAIGDTLRKVSRFAPLLQFLARRGWLTEVAGAPIDQWLAFRKLSMPTLLVHGALSDVLTPGIVTRMQAEKRDLEVLEVPDRGHAPLLDEAGVPERIEAFLAALPR